MSLFVFKIVNIKNSWSDSTGVMATRCSLVMTCRFILLVVLYVLFSMPYVLAFLSHDYAECSKKGIAWDLQVQLSEVRSS